MRTIYLFVYAAAVGAIPILTVVGTHHAAPQERSIAVELADEPALDEPAVRALAGVWSRYEPGVEGEPLRFYYFHGDGKGLYRYGKVGLNNTHSFDYDVSGDELVLVFRKTGVTHRVQYELSTGDRGRDWLVLHGDPEEAGTTRYFRDRPGPIEPHAEGADLGPPPAGHMWIDFKRFATGGSEFHFYQFRPAGIDGRGVGWFHRGDFDDWATESLTYRIVGDRIELAFPLRGDERHTTSFALTREDGQRVMTLQSDPRDFWHAHRYVDAGPSFGGAAFDVELLSGR